jgi:hypothetical protein
VVREWPAPRMADTGAPRQVGPEATRVGGQPLAGGGRRLQQGVVREALMRADQGTERRGDGEGAQAIGPRERRVHVVLEPLLGCLLLTLGTVAVPTGMLDAVVCPAALARRKAVTVRAALALVDGTDDLAVREGTLGERSKDAGAKAVTMSRRVRRAGARA